jgi:hypothetical protein
MFSTFKTSPVSKQRMILNRHKGEMCTQNQALLQPKLGSVAPQQPQPPFSTYRMISNYYPFLIQVIVDPFKKIHVIADPGRTPLD